MSVETAAATVSTAAATRTERLPLFDNAKFAAVALVVCAHTWMPLLTADRTRAPRGRHGAGVALAVVRYQGGKFARPRPGPPRGGGRGAGGGG
ncbi:hypothetical protein ACFV0G_28960, partial [Kitasatospora sp. NPDC059571]